MFRLLFQLVMDNRGSPICTHVQANHDRPKSTYKCSLPMVQSVCPMDGLSKRKRSLCRPQFQCKPYSNRNVSARQTNKKKHLKIRQPILLTVKETIERRRRSQGKNPLYTGISVWPPCVIFVVWCHRIRVVVETGVLYSIQV